jgi:peptidoglycan hydrolase-like protein with peptidoglycan-binding domain
MPDNFLVALVAVRRDSPVPLVQNLQSLLSRLNFGVVPDDERNAGKYGDGTAKIVADFQHEFSLAGQIPGELDAATANFMNEHAFTKGIFFKVRGSITDTKGARRPDFNVKIFDADNIAGDAAATSRSNADGVFQAYYDPTFYRVGRPGVPRPKDKFDLIAIAFGSDNKPIGQSEKVSDPTSDAKANIVLPIQTPNDQKSDQRSIRGIVVSQSGDNLVGVEVNAFDRDIGSARQRLGDQGSRFVTDEQGAFLIPYSEKDYIEGEGNAEEGGGADLVFSISRDNQEARILSIVRLPVPDDPTISTAFAIPDAELLIGIAPRKVEAVLIRVDLAQKKATVTEYERLLADLKKIAGQLDLSAFNEEKTQDITFAARETGWDRTLISYMVRAHQLGKQDLASVDPEPIYGLLRKLEFSDLSVLCAHSVDELVGILELQVRDSIIMPPTSAIASIAKEVRRLASQHVLRTVPEGSMGSISAIISPSLADSDRQVKIIDQLTAANSNLPEFWKNFHVANPDIDVPMLQSSIQLGNITRNNEALVNQIRSTFPAARSLRALAFELDSARVEALIIQSGAPLPDRDETESLEVARKRYAASIAGVLEAAHPTATVAKLSKTWTTEAPQTISPHTAKLLESVVMSTDYELGSGRIDDLIKEHSALLFAGVANESEKTEAVAGFKRVERLYRVSTSPATLSAVVTKLAPGGSSFSGAFDIARTSKSAFVAQFPTATAELRAGLERVHANASALMETATSILIGDHQASNETIPILKTVPDSVPAPPVGVEVPAPKRELPTARSLLGNNVMCECKECRSAWGAPAYLVHVLEYFGHRCGTNKAGVTPLDILIGNKDKGIPGLRPDLAHIKLTCENTDTTLPTIDLINEILESAVSAAIGAAAAVPPPRPGLTSAELAAEPQAYIESAYDELAKTYFPIGLPFDRVVASTRAHLQQVKSSRTEVIEVFAGDAHAKTRWACERLNLLPLDWEILTGEDFAGSAKNVPTETLYGFSVGDATWLTGIQTVAELTDRLEISVSDLIAITRSKTVSGNWPKMYHAILDRFPISVGTFKKLREQNFASSPKDVTDLLEWVEFPLTDLKTFSDSTIELQKRTAVIDPPDVLDKDKMKVMHLDGSLLGESDFRLLHRFVRLARRLKIAPAELDVLLGAVSAERLITSSTLHLLAALIALKERLQLDSSSAAAFISDIDTDGPSSLFVRLFVRSGLAKIDPLFQPSPDGAVFTIVPASSVDNLVGTMSSLFGQDTKSVAAIVKDYELASLDLAAVSTIWRHFTLANALEVEPEILFKLLLRESMSLKSKSIDIVKLLDFVKPNEKRSAKGFHAENLFFQNIRSSEIVSERNLSEVLSSIRSDLAKLETKTPDAAIAAKPAIPVETPEEKTKRENDEKARREKFEQAQKEQRIAIVVSAIALAFELNSDLAKWLMSEVGPIRGTGDLPAHALFLLKPSTTNDRDSVAELEDIERTAALLREFELTMADVELLGKTLSLLPSNLSSIFHEANSANELRAVWNQIAHYFALKGHFNDRREIFSNVLKALVSTPEADWISVVSTELASLFKITVDSAKAVVDRSLKSTTIAALKSHPISALVNIERLAGVCFKTGTPATELAILAEGATGGKGRTALNALIRGVKDRHNRGVWLSVAKQINDPLRESRRDALVSYLVHQKKLKNRDELFGIFLIDPQINAFLLTSPISNAHATCQIHAQRIRLGIYSFESDDRLKILPTQIDTEWEVLGSFRLWQAGEIVKAFPHHYMITSQRDDMTPLFRELMGFVRQNDPTPVNLELAISNYLRGLSEIANLEICGTFLQKEFVGKDAPRYTSVLHVIGRTRGGINRKYFYRRLNQYQSSEAWTAWESVKVDIQAIERDRPGGRVEGEEDKLDPGVHVLPVVWGQRLYLFWPTFVRKVRTKNQKFKINLEGGEGSGESNASLPEPYWEVKLALSCLEDNNWTPKQISSDYFETLPLPSSGSIRDNIFAQTVDRSLVTGAASKAMVAIKTPAEEKQEAIALSIQIDSVELLETPAPTPAFNKFARRKITKTSYTPQPKEYVLKADLSAGKLAVHIVRQQPNQAAQRLAAFSFDHSRSDVIVRDIGGSVSGDHPAFAGTSRYFMGLSGSGSLKAVTAPEKPEGFTILENAPAFRISPVNQYYGDPLSAPFFFSDSERSYFVKTEPKLGLTLKQAEKPALASPVVNASKAVSVVEKQTAVIVTAMAQRSDSKPWQRSESVMVAKAGGSLLQSMAPSSQRESLKSNANVAERAKHLPFFDHSYFGAGSQQTSVPAIAAKFSPFYHPQVEDFIVAMQKHGLEELFEAYAEGDKGEGTRTTFAARYKPNKEFVLNSDLREIPDYGPGTPYGPYNAEIFLYANMLVAELQGPEAAVKTLSRILDPLSPQVNPHDAWKYHPFRHGRDLDYAELLGKLSSDPSDPDRKAIEAQIEQSRLFPFQPFRIARLRPNALKKWVFIETVKAWLKWGEFHHAIYQPEDLSKAFQLYLVPAMLFGPKTELLPPRDIVPPKSYAELRPLLDASENADLTVIEDEVAPLVSLIPSASGPTSSAGLGHTLRTISTRYFCLPPDTKMLELQDRVYDRLYKLRNGMTLDGVRRQPPLFGPKFDPAALVKAAANGIDLQSAADAAIGLQRPHHRWEVRLRIARERVDLLANITSQLFATLEKKDAEHITLMRAKHEKAMLDFQLDVRTKQIEEADQTIRAYDFQRGIAYTRWDNMRSQLGADDVVAPTSTLVATAIEPVGTVKAFGTYTPKRPFKLVDGAAIEIPLGVTTRDVTLLDGKILEEEKTEAVESYRALASTIVGSALDATAGVLSVVPNFEAAGKPTGVGAGVHFGGQQLGAGVGAYARVAHASSTIFSYKANNAARKAAFIWRERDFAERMNTAAAEMLHIDQLTIGAMKRKEILIKEKENHVKQTDQSIAILDYLSTKFTAEPMLAMVEKRLKECQQQCWSAVLSAIEEARACFEYDWQDDAPDPPSNAWDSQLRGLYSAEPLRIFLNLLEDKYMSKGRQGLDVTYQISLRQIDPFALIQLKQTGTCTLKIDEAFLDLQFPGHYMRRIHSLAISLPCVTGPTTTLGAILRQTKSSVRLNTSDLANYARKGPDDTRFKDIFLPTEQVIAVSTGRMDSGLSDTSKNDGLYRPFEGTGAISEWTLSLPDKYRPLDYNSFVDCLITLECKDRSGGDEMKEKVENALANELNTLKNSADKNGLFMLFSARHDFPDVWHKSRTSDPARPMTLTIDQNMIPFAFRKLAKRGLSGSSFFAVTPRVIKASEKLSFSSISLLGAERGPWTVTIPLQANDVEDVYLLSQFVVG